MKRLLLVGASLLLALNVLHAQTGNRSVHLPHNAYQLKLPEGKVQFSFSESEIIVSLKPGVDAASFFASRSSQFARPYAADWNVPFPEVYRAAISTTPGKTYEQAVAELSADPQVAYIAPVLVYNNLKQSLYDLFYVKLKQSGDMEKLRALANTLHFKIEPRQELGVHLCRIDKASTGNSFEIAAYLQSLDIFEIAEPDFIYTCQPNTSDPAYSLQWPIKNIGHPNADMKVEQAWGITTGNSSIKVAVLDFFGSTAQFNHPDISFLSTYDATGNGFYSSGYEADAHGICCAGIIKATANNSLGGAGIAYGASIIAVKIASIDFFGNGSATGYSISKGIDWACQNADVVSNSNSFGSSSSLVDIAIQKGLDYGRNGKGTLMFSSAGNGDSTSIVYPASNPKTIAVGATSMCDKRKSSTSCDGEYWWGSDYGVGLDIAAPGVKIFTTDLAGTAGRSLNDYDSAFNGTSAACPAAAAVMALILSANPNLSAANARQIIESTCNKVGGYSYSNVAGQPNGTWSTNLGYGRVNAYDALTAAGNACSSMPATATISGPANTYASTGFTLTSSVVANNTGMAYQWESSANGSTGWAAISGATNSQYTAASGITATTWYRLKSTCTNGNLSSNSNVKKVNLTSSITQSYCVPIVDYSVIQLTKVAFAGINFTNSGFGIYGYQDFTNVKGSVLPSNTYPFSCKVSAYYANLKIAAWIDYNQDGVFANPGERALLGAPDTNFLFSGNINIPSTAADGNTVMRIRLDTNPSPDPCDTTEFGNVEDYTINICSPRSVQINASATDVCAGTSITFTSTPVYGGAMPAYQWKRNGANIAGATNASYTAVFSTSTPISLVMTPTTACYGTPKVTSNTIAINVTPIVTPTVSINASATTIVSGTNVIFTATPSGGGSTPVYQWKKNGIDIGTNSSTYSDNTLQNGDVINCQLSISAVCATSLTAISNNKIIGITPSSCTATIAAGGPLNFCPGGSVVLTANPDTAYGTTYLWSTGATTRSITVTQSKNVTVKVKANGCMSTSPVTKVSVKALPDIVIKNSVALDFCYGTTVTLSLSPTINLTGYDDTSFQWQKGTTAIPGATNRSYIVDTDGSYKLTVTAGPTCNRSSLPKTLTEKPLPIATSTAMSITSFCPGGSVTLKAGLHSGQTYKWYKDGVFTSSGDTKVATAAGSYVLQAKLGNCLVDAASIVVTLFPLPASQVTSSPSASFCANDSLMLNALPSDPSYTYQWKKSNSILSSTTAQQMVTTAGTYTVKVTDNNNCQKTSPGYAVSTISLPPATITMQGPTTIAANGSTILKANGSSPTYTWQWYLDDVAIAGDTNRNCTASVGGVYKVRVTKGGCSAFSAPKTIIQTSAREEAAVTSVPELTGEKFELVAYPNPVTHMLTITTRGTMAKKASVQVMTLAGAMIMQTDCTDGQVSIDMSPYAPGVYLIRYKDALDRNGVLRIVKQ
jgi:hypothetical protein